MDYWIGADLGKHVDYAAVSVLGRSLAIDRRTGMPRRNSQGDPLYQWRVRALQRFPLRTPYPVVARKIARIATMPELRPAPRVVLDSSGVGVAVVEMVRTELARHPEIECWGVSWTAGESWRVIRKHELSAAKIQIVGSLAAALHSGRLRVCRKADGSPIDGADVLERELAAFKVHQSKRSDAELMGAESGAHDDMVASVALPIFAGGLRMMQMRTRDTVTLARESSALTAEEDAEALALEREEAALGLGETPRVRLEREARLAALRADPFGAFEDDDDEMEDDDE